MEAMMKKTPQNRDSTFRDMAMSMTEIRTAFNVKAVINPLQAKLLLTIIKFKLMH